MTDVNASIHINIDSSGAHADLKRLQSDISAFNRSITSANTSAASSAAALNRALLDSVNATGMFQAKMVPVVGSVDRFTHALENNKLSLGEYTRYAASQIPGLGRVFRREFDMMESVARDRVKKMQTQYIALGKTAKGVQEAMAITPTGLGKGMATDLAIATQKAQIFNKMIDDGSTKLLNWGKNTQWAGRQLMVGFSLPLAALGTVAAQTFMELDKVSTAFKRVYGDLSTSTAEMERNLGAMTALGVEYTKYGIAVKDTLALSARVAATGMQNQDLARSTEQTLRFATLGQMDYNTALDATISLQTAFGISSEDLAQNIDYLNAVENQTVLTIEDMAQAVPRVATVIKGLGGDVKDLAVFMTAMREGGVSAENAANALKSGLASLINPTQRAQETMAKLGIDMQAIINTNRGDLMATVQAFGQALSAVDEFSQTQALEQIFGKYQYARMGALFKNIASDSSQAARAMDIASMSAEQLGQIAEKELSTISESTTVKFAAAMENLKLAIAPLGEAFLKGIMPVVDAITKIADLFNNLPDPVKNAIAAITGVVAGLGPVFLMTIGLIGNGLANLIKGVQFFRKRLAGIRGDASSFQHLATAEIEAMSASEALEKSVQSLTTSLGMQSGALGTLIEQYERYAIAAGIASAAGRGGGGKGGPAPLPTLKMARGGVVPGTGNKDSIPALLTPGESVITKGATQKYGPVLAAMNAGTLQGLNGGTRFSNVESFQQWLINELGFSESGAAKSQMSNLGQRIVRDGIELHSDRLIEAMTDNTGQLISTQRSLKQALLGAYPDVDRKSFSMRKFGRESGGGPRSILAESAAFDDQGMFGSARGRLLEQLSTDPSIPQDRLREYLGIDASHIMPERDDQGKIWRGQNILPDFTGVNRTVNNRMNSFSVALRDGVTSVDEVVGMIRSRTNDLVQDMSDDDLRREIVKLANGFHPLTENATRAAGALADLDVMLAGDVGGVGKTAIGTEAKTAYQSRFMSAGMRDRLNNQEEYFGQNGLLATRYQYDDQRSTTETRARAEAAATAAFDRGVIEGEQEVAGRRRGIAAVAGEGDDLIHATRSRLRNSPHPQADIDGTDDEKAYQDARAKYRASQSDERRTLRNIDMIPQTRQRVMNEAVAEASKGGGDRRQAIKSARLRVASMSDEDFLTIIEKEENDRIAQEKKASSERRKVRAQADSRIARSRNAEAKEEARAGTARKDAAHTRALDTLKNISNESAKSKAYDIQTRKQTQGRVGIGSRVSGALGANAGRIGMGAGMAMSMGSMLPMMMQNEQGKFMGVDAGAASMGMMGGGMLLSMAGIIPAPILAVVAAAGAAAVAFKAWRGNLDDAAREAADFGSTLGGASNAAKKMADILGKSTPLQNRTNLQLSVGKKDQEQFAKYNDMLQNEGGQAFIGELKALTGEERFARLTDYVKTAVASGMMEATEGQLFAKAVANQLKDAVLGARVSAAVANQKTGSDAMMSLAQQRDKAIMGNARVANVVNSTQRDSVNSADAAATISAATQAMEAYNQAVAKAEEEYRNGEISFAQLSSAVNTAKEATDRWSGAIKNAYDNTDDLGATQAGAQRAMDLAGIDEKAQAALEESYNQLYANSYGSKGIGLNAMYTDAEGKRKSIGNETGFLAVQDLAVNAGYGDSFNEVQRYLDENKGSQDIIDIANRSRLQDQVTGNDSLKYATQQYAAQTGDPVQAEAMMNAIFNDAGALQKFIDGGATVQSFTDALAAANASLSLFSESLKGDYTKIAESLITPESKNAFDAYMSSSKDEAQQRERLANIKGIGAGMDDPTAARTAFLATRTALTEKGASQDLMDQIQGSRAYKESLKQTKKGTRSGGIPTSTFDDTKEKGIRESATKAVEAGVSEKVIKYVFETTGAEDAAAKMDDMTEKVQKLDALPNEIKVALGIDLESPENIEKLGSDTEAITRNWEALKNLDPNIDMNLVAKAAILDEDGKPITDPTKVSKNIMALNKAYKSLEGAKTKAAKIKAQVKIATEYLTEDGKKAGATGKGIVAAVNKNLAKIGKSLNDLPAPQVSKAIAIQTALEDTLAKKRVELYEAQLKEMNLARAGDIEGAKAAAEDVARISDEMKNAKLTAISQQQGLSFNGGGSGNGGGGGGGGGEKSNPYKDFKGSIVTQLKTFADMEVSMKDLLSKKNSFFNLLKANNGLDDQIRKAGITGPMAEELMGMDPKEAKKIMSRITGKGGKLNAEGRKLQDRYMAGQISETDYNNQVAIDTAMAQSRAVENAGRDTYFKMPKKPNKVRGRMFGGGEMSSYGLQALADPAIAKQYNFLVDKVLSASKRVGDGAKKAYNIAAEAVSNFVKQTEKAAKLQAGIQAIIEHDTSIASQNQTRNMVNMARGQGLSQEQMNDIASGSQNDYYMGLQEKAKQEAENAKANPKDKAAQKRAREAKAEADNFWDNYKKEWEQRQKDMADANPLQYMSDYLDQEMNDINTSIDTITANLTEASNIEFEATFGKTKDEAEILIKKNNVIIQQYQQQIDLLQQAVSSIQHEVDVLEHSKKAYQDQIDKIQDSIDAYQRRVDLLQHENDLRSHQVDLIEHDLDIMSKAEDSINKQYDKRIEALTQIQQLNDHAIQQQQQQLGLAQALSTGDVYAAAAAAQEMQASQVQYASEMNMQALDKGRENAIGSLRTSDGMTREQSEQRIWEINQQNWQTEQEIYAINQKIYEENLKMLPLKDAINSIDDQIATKNELIWQKNQEMYAIQVNSIDPLQKQNKEWQNRLDLSSSNLEVAIMEGTANERAQINSLKLQQQQIKQTQAQAEKTNYLAKSWKNVTQQIAEANRLLKDRNATVAQGKWEELGTLTAYNDDGTVNLEKTMQNIKDEYSGRLSEIRKQMDKLGQETGAYAGGRIGYAAAGSVGGDGSRDSVRALLTPGEFVVRKAMVEKYGIPLLESINTGSFDMPTYKTPSVREVSPQGTANISNIAAPVYNTYSVNVSASTNASADDIAHTVLTKIKSIENMSVRRINGY